MRRQRLTDIAWQYCQMIDGNHCHVRCNFCGHTMWGGVSRLKQHLAQKRGDVIACNKCPHDVIKLMQEHLIELSLKRESIERINREKLEDMKKMYAEPHALPHEAPNTEEIDAEEKASIEQAIKESLETLQMEKERAKRDADEELEAACRESMQYYKEESRRRGKGSSSSRPGPSSYYEIIDYDDSDFSDFSFE